MPNRKSTAGQSPLDAKVKDGDPNLISFYLQVTQADAPAILGVKKGASGNEIKQGYHKAALHLHPNKCRAHLRELHTRLFQKIQEAYERILGDSENDESFDTPEQDFTPSANEYSAIGETSLHARNLDFKEALRKEREAALALKREADAKTAAKKASQAVKDERLASKRMAGQAAAEAKEAAREKRILKEKDRMRSRHKQSGGSERKQNADTSFETADTTPDSWEDAEDRATAINKESSGSVCDHPKRSKKYPIGGAKSDLEELNKPLPEDGPEGRPEGRWNKDLLSGKPSNISIAEKHQREHNIEANLFQAQITAFEPATGGNALDTDNEDKAASQIMAELNAEVDEKSCAAYDRFGQDDFFKQYLEEAANAKRTYLWEVMPRLIQEMMEWRDGMRLLEAAGVLQLE